MANKLSSWTLGICQEGMLKFLQIQKSYSLYTEFGGLFQMLGKEKLFLGFECANLTTILQLYFSKSLDTFLENGFLLQLLLVIVMGYWVT
jgi:hypothetical protein